MSLPAVLSGLLGQGLQVRPADGPGPALGRGTAGDHRRLVVRTTPLPLACRLGTQAALGPPGFKDKCCVKVVQRRGGGWRLGVAAGRRPRWWCPRAHGMSPVGARVVRR